MNIDLEQLKQAALATDYARWNTEGFEQIAGTGAFYGGLIMHENGHTIIAQQVMSPHAEFIAAASPAVVLELVSRLEKAEAAAAAPQATVLRGWQFSVKDSDDRTWLTIKTPHGASASLSCATNHESGETIPAQVLHYLRDAIAAKLPASGHKSVHSAQNTGPANMS